MTARVRSCLQGAARSGFSSPDRAMRDSIANWCRAVSACPFRVGGANRAGRSGIGIEAKNGQRRSAPHCAGDELSGPLAPAAQPGHGRACQGDRIISRTRDHRNRHLSRNRAPVLPAMELRKIVRPHDPYEASPGITPPDRTQRIDSETRAQLALDGGGADARAARLPHCRGQPRLERSHARHRLQHVAGRDQPPHLVQPERADGEKTDAAVAAVRGVEAASEQAGERGGSAQGRVCPLPRTSHL